MIYIHVEQTKKEKKTGKFLDENLDEKGSPYKYWYKKQVEFYQWLFRKNNFSISNTAYFLFCSALYHDVREFKDKLHFVPSIVPYEGDDSWIDQTIIGIKNVLDGEQIPDSNPNCDHCNYAKKINNVTNQ